MMGDGEMPKECITSPTPVHSQFVTQIAWGRDSGYVQIATLAPLGREQLKQFLDGWGYDLVRRPSINADSDDLVSFDGWHATLDDRRQVNDLIRILRRARDQAFGRDE